MPVLKRRRAEVDPRAAGGKRPLQRGVAADAARQLHLDVQLPDHGCEQLSVGAATKRRVQVDQVDPLRSTGQVNVMGGALRSYVTLCVTEIRRWVVDEAAPHDDVGLLILDRFPCPQDTLAAETAALGDPLRALVVEMSDELNPHDSIVSKGPLSDETERLHRDTTASNPTIKPVERLGSTRGEIELNTNLTSAFV